MTKPNRHPGLVPGSTAPQAKAPVRVLHGGCRNKSGMTVEIIEVALIVGRQPSREMDVDGAAHALGDALAAFW